MAQRQRSALSGQILSFSVGSYGFRVGRVGAVSDSVNFILFCTVQGHTNKTLLRSVVGDLHDHHAVQVHRSPGPCCRLRQWRR